MSGWVSEWGQFLPLPPSHLTVPPRYQAHCLGTIGCWGREGGICACFFPTVSQLRNSRIHKSLVFKSGLFGCSNSLNIHGEDLWMPWKVCVCSSYLSKYSCPLILAPRIAGLRARSYPPPCYAMQPCCQRCMLWEEHDKMAWEI